MTTNAERDAATLGREKVPYCVAPARDQNRLAGLIADWVREHLGVEHVLFSTRYGLARTILNDGYAEREPVVVDDATDWQYGLRSVEDGLMLGISPMPSLEAAQARAANIRGGWEVVRRAKAGQWLALTPDEQETDR